MTAIASFTSATGDQPYASVMFDTVVGRPSALYTVTTAAAGDCLPGYGCGSIVKLSPTHPPGGTWTMQLLHAFVGTEGYVPYGNLIEDSSGALYGTATRGGGGTCPDGAGCGTVFKLSPAAVGGASWTLTVLHRFTGGADGGTPTAGLVFDTFGALYGTALVGGAHGDGAVYRLAPPAVAGGAWTETVLHDFSGKDGARPRSSLIFDSAGALYGTTDFGGAFNLGTVFRLAAPPAAGGGWTETILHSFTGGADGAEPYSSLVFDSAGALYGTTWKGGASGGGGVAFKLSPPATNGDVWTESAFVLSDSTGSRPRGNLTLDTFGVLYGTTTRGGTGNCSLAHCGTIFSLFPPAGSDGAWVRTVLGNFNGINGGDTAAAPVFLGGNLFGTAEFGGSANVGTVFRLSP